MSVSLEKWGAVVPVSLELLHPREGHEEPVTSDAEWEAELAVRRARFAEWEALTEALLAGGVIERAHCYECDGTLALSGDRPMRWVDDETEEEWRARIGASGGASNM